MPRPLRALGHVSLIAAVLLASCPLTAAADDATELADFMIAAFKPEGVPRREPVSIEAEQDMRNFSKLLMSLPNPPKLEDLEATISAALDPISNIPWLNLDDGIDQEERMVDAVLKLVGHGARRVEDWMPAAKVGKAPKTSTPSAHKDRWVWLVTLPNLDVTIRGSPMDCPAFHELLNGMPTNEPRGIGVGIEGIALDLRATRGGKLVDVACIASAFVQEGTPLFSARQVPEKPRLIEAFTKEGRTPIALPLVIMINRDSDQAALMVATVLRNLGRARIVGERPADFDGAILGEFVFGGFGSFRNYKKEEPGYDNRDPDGSWYPMRIRIPMGEFTLPNDHPPDVVLHADVQVRASDENAMLKVAATTILTLELEPK